MKITMKKVIVNHSFVITYLFWLFPFNAQAKNGKQKHITQNESIFVNGSTVQNRVALVIDSTIQ